MLDTRIDGGLVASPYGDPAPWSVGIANGRIAAVGEITDLPAREVIDAGGAVVLPGAVDTHVHLGFTNTSEEWVTESRAAAIGGVTTPMIYFRDPRPYDKLLPEFLAEGERKSQVNFGVHLGILVDQHLDNLDAYLDQFGVRSVKMYTTYKHGELASFGVQGQDDGFILDVMRALARRDVTVNVHCENDDIVERGQRRWMAAGDPPAAQWASARPAVAEVEAIRRMGLFARETGCQLYVPHLSSRQGLEAAVEERRLGARLHAETCPQYLLAERVSGAGNLVKVNPPVRPDETGEALWAALEAGVIDTVGTDHACWRRADKAGDVGTARPGFPGLGTVVPALLDGVSRGTLSLATFARIQHRAAAIFGLRGHGLIAPGYVADLCIADMSARRTVDAAALGGRSDFTPYEGLELVGWPVMTIQAGRVIARDGEVTGEPAGRYVRRLTGHYPR